MGFQHPNTRMARFERAYDNGTSFLSAPVLRVQAHWSPACWLSMLHTKCFRDCFQKTKRRDSPRNKKYCPSVETWYRKGGAMGLGWGD